MHRLDHGMFGAERAADAGEGDVERGQFRASRVLLADIGRTVTLCNDPRAVAVTASTRTVTVLISLTRCPTSRLASFGAAFSQRSLICGEHAVLARHPAVAEDFPVGFGLDRRGFLLQRGEQLLDGFVQRGRR